MRLGIEGCVWERGETRGMALSESGLGSLSVDLMLSFHTAVVQMDNTPSTILCVLIVVQMQLLLVKPSSGGDWMLYRPECVH
jgi:hypothetical protein